MMGHPSDEHDRWVSVVPPSEDRAQHGHDQTVVAVVFGRFQDEPWLAGAGSASPRLADQGFGELGRRVVGHGLSDVTREKSS